MRREMTLRRRLLPIFILATGIPIVLFALISQYRLRSSLNENIQMQIDNNLNRADQSLDMILDKYDTLLYDLCTDDEIIGIVEDINQKKDTLEVNSSRIRHELSHICNRNDGIEGITIITEENQVIFYDRLSASSVSSSWADKIRAPEVVKGALYRGVGQPIESGNDKVYMFQIIREFVDYRDIHKSIGTVILSINTDVLEPVLDAGQNADIYLLQKGKIIAAYEEDKCGKKLDAAKDEEFRYTRKMNEMSGFTICNAQSLRLYHQTLKEQILFWIFIAVGAILLLMALTYSLTRPYLKEIDQIADAMSQAEQGNFQARVPVTENMTVEVRKISSGFNEMVGHIDSLINQVKEAVVEQKNAELSALEAQIDPHFLYNTLDTINWKAIELGEFEISEMLGALADILRYTVKNAGAETSIEQELHWLAMYILLQKAKLGRELQVEVKVPEELYGYRIHKLLLQPFVENAIRHGLKQKEGELKLGITMRSAGGQMHIIVKDNGSGIPEDVLQRLNDSENEADEKDSGEHMGIVNVRKRLNLYYGDQADLYFESALGKYTKVHLFIPVVSPHRQADEEGRKEEGQ